MKIKTLQSSGTVGVFTASLVAVVVAVGAFTVYRVVNSGETAIQPIASISEVEDTALAEDEIFTLEEPVELLIQADVDSLPPKTPISFVEYLETILPESADEQCTKVYSVNAISLKNISASVSLKSTDSGSVCGSGSATVWYVDANGEWGQKGFQDAATCDELIELQIYEEFSSLCRDGEFGELVTNPVGSYVNRNTSDSEVASIPEVQVLGDNEILTLYDGSSEDPVLSNIDNRVEFASRSELSALPPETPQSFIDFVSDTLEETREEGCIAITSIKKISNENILGGSNSGMSDGSLSNICGGGVGLVWYLDDSGEWQRYVYQDIQYCEELKELIYSEFIEECFVSDTDLTVIPNPNGSYADRSSN